LSCDRDISELNRLDALFIFEFDLWQNYQSYKFTNFNYDFDYYMKDVIIGKTDRNSGSLFSNCNFKYYEEEKEYRCGSFGNQKSNEDYSNFISSNNSSKYNKKKTKI